MLTIFWGIVSAVPRCSLWAIPEYSLQGVARDVHISCHKVFCVRCIKTESSCKVFSFVDSGCSVFAGPSWPLTSFCSPKVFSLSCPLISFGCPKVFRLSCTLSVLGGPRCSVWPVSWSVFFRPKVLVSAVAWLVWPGVFILFWLSAVPSYSFRVCHQFFFLADWGCVQF